MTRETLRIIDVVSLNKFIYIIFQDVIGEIFSRFNNPFIDSDDPKGEKIFRLTVHPLAEFEFKTKYIIFPKFFFFISFNLTKLYISIISLYLNEIIQSN